MDDGVTSNQKLDSVSHSKPEKSICLKKNSGYDNNHVSKSDIDNALTKNSFSIKVPEPCNYDYPDIEKIKNEIKRDLQKRYDDDIASIMSELFEHRKSTASIK